MKSFLMASLMVVSSFSFAADLQPGRSLPAVQILSAQAEVVGHGFPLTHVTAQATFSNSCYVPAENELVQIVTYSKNFDDVQFTLGAELDDRACPQIYAPVTVTIDLGKHTKPNDGTFRKITVNGVVAK